jgi:hypothetical protein
VTTLLILVWLRVPTDAATPEISELYLWYRGTLSQDIWMALGFLGVVLLLLLFLIWITPTSAWPPGVALGLTLIILVIGSGFHEARRKEVFRQIDALKVDGGGEPTSASLDGKS